MVEGAGAKLCWAATEPGLQVERAKRENRKAILIGYATVQIKI
jgi:hypothetical protein